MRTRNDCSLCGRDSGLPHRGLPDARLTLQDEGPEPIDRTIEEPLDHGELGVSPDDLGRHGRAIIGSLLDGVQ